MEMKEQKKSIVKFTKSVRKLIDNDFDCVVAISGIEGIGKSALAVRLASAYDENFDLEQGVIYTSDAGEVTTRMTNAHVKAFVVDEAMRIFYKMNWAKAEQKYLNELFAVSRKLNNVVFLCIPRFHDLNEYFRNHRVRLWVHCLSRGKAVVFKRLTGAFAMGDVWRFNENWKQEEKAVKKKRDTMKIYTRLPNFAGVIRWNKLPATVERHYKKIATKVIHSMDNREVEDSMGIRASMWHLRIGQLSHNIKRKYNIPIAQQAKAAGLGVRGLTDAAARYVRYTEKRQQVKPYKLITNSSISTDKLTIDSQCQPIYTNRSKINYGNELQIVQEQGVAKTKGTDRKRRNTLTGNYKKHRQINTDS